MNKSSEEDLDFCKMYLGRVRDAIEKVEDGPVKDALKALTSLGHVLVGEVFDHAEVLEEATNDIIELDKICGMPWTGQAPAWAQPTAALKLTVPATTPEKLPEDPRRVE